MSTNYLNELSLADRNVRQTNPKWEGRHFRPPDLSFIDDLLTSPPQIHILYKIPTEG